jgi:hypothetical protein
MAKPTATAMPMGVIPHGHAMPNSAEVLGWAYCILYATKLVGGVEDGSSLQHVHDVYAVVDIVPASSPSRLVLLL